MKTNFIFLIFAFVSGIFFTKASTPETEKVQHLFGNQNKTFEQNKGQMGGKDGKNVKYFLKNGSMTFYLLSNGISYQFTKNKLPNGGKMNENMLSPEEILKNLGNSEKIKTETYRMDMILQNSNPNAKITTENPETSVINYLNKNVLDVKRFSQITYHEIYPNIDWVIYIKNGDVEYDFVVRPGGNPNRIKFKNKWAESMKLNDDGSMTMTCKLGSITEKSPISFQNGKTIPTKMVLKNGTLSFNLENYNPESTLRIDPVISWSTYFGGNSDDFGTATVSDASNNVYLTGYTLSGSGIASGGYQNSNAGNYDAFLAKFTSSGTLVWATYYGGNSEDRGKSLAIDASGNIYMAGQTYSASGIASASASQNSLAGQNDAFLVKFDNNGNPIWATYFGGEYYDEGYSCAVDHSGNVYMAGFAWSSTGITTSGAHQPTSGGATDGFLVKFDSSGTKQWSTYYGGELWETGYCATDPAGNVYLAGFTSSTVNISTTGAHQTILGWGDDANLVKFNSDGVRQWGTYYGGSDYDWAYFIATDSAGNVYLDGHTGSDGVIATPGAFQTTRGGSYDAFLAKFDGTGTRIWGTYYGGTGQERASACTVDSNNNIIVAGYTYSAENIASSNAFQTVYGGNQDVFAVKFDNNGNRIWGSYFGGDGDDFGAFCSSDAEGNIYLTGHTNSTSNISTTGAFQTGSGGSMDAFLVKISDADLGVNNASLKSLTIYPNPATDYIYIKNPQNIKISNLEIYSVDGKRILSQNQIQNEKIEVSKLREGLYILRLQTNEGDQNLKFIKK